MISVTADNYKLRLEQIEALTKLVRISQFSSIIELGPGNDPLGELIQEMAIDIAQYSIKKTFKDKAA